MHLQVVPGAVDPAAILLSVIRSKPPVGHPCIDYVATGHRLLECSMCETWWAEAVVDSTGQLVIREWHDGACEALYHLKSSHSDAPRAQAVAYAAS